MKKIEFFSSCPGVADVCPIVPASQYRPKWMSAARDDYIKEIKTHPERYSHIYQCPGIFDLFNHGFIVPMWHDVSIKTNGTRDGFGWMIPDTGLADFEPGKILVDAHPPAILKFIPSKPTAIKSVVKFNTPWHVVAPRGVKFLLIPIAYPDEFDFESHIGILDPAINSEINIQLSWNIINGEKIIKAGTPMMHMIPLSSEQFDCVCRDMTANDKRWLEVRKYLTSFTFKLKRNVITDMYYKHFRKT